MLFTKFADRTVLAGSKAPRIPQRTWFVHILTESEAPRLPRCTHFVHVFVGLEAPCLPWRTLFAHSMHKDNKCTHWMPVEMPHPRVSVQWRGAGKDTLKICGSTFFFSFLFCFGAVVHCFTRSFVECS